MNTDPSSKHARDKSPQEMLRRVFAVANLLAKSKPADAQFDKRRQHSYQKPENEDLRYRESIQSFDVS